MSSSPFVASCVKLIQACFSKIHITTLVPILDGWDYLVLEVNGEVMFRFPRRPEVQRWLEKEVALLPDC